jgi:hypothetical protein
MPAKEQIKMVAYQICNTVGCADNYPTIYQAAYEIQHKGRLTKKTAKLVMHLQSEDVRKFNYVPEALLTQLYSIIPNNAIESKWKLVP